MLHIQRWSAIGGLMSRWRAGPRAGLDAAPSQVGKTDHHARTDVDGSKIEIAVPVDVGERDMAIEGAGPDPLGWSEQRGPRRAEVLEQVDATIDGRGRDQVQVAVAIEVPCGDRPTVTRLRTGERLLPEEAPLVVPEDQDGLRPRRRQPLCDDVLIAVGVEVGECDERHGGLLAVHWLNQDLHGPCGRFTPPRVPDRDRTR